MNDEQQMADKVFLITGGTGGIGKATAIRLATIGARAGITGRDLGVVPCQRCPGVGRLVPRMRVRGRVGQYKGPSSRLYASAPACARQADPEHTSGGIPALANPALLIQAPPVGRAAHRDRSDVV